MWLVISAGSVQNVKMYFGGGGVEGPKTSLFSLVYFALVDFYGWSGKYTSFPKFI